MKYMTFYESPLGVLTLTSDGESLTSLRIGEYPPIEDQMISRSLPFWNPVNAWLDLYFEGRDPGPSPVPLNPQGTPFQKQVWDLLLKIPYGETLTYGNLAEKMASIRGKPRMSPQAIGSAVSKNPIALVIPCHRVLGAGGTLTGFAYGLDAKKFLLELEEIPYT